MLCRFAGYTKQAYYSEHKDWFTDLAIEELIIEFIQEIREQDPGMGVDKIWPMYNLLADRQPIGRDRFYAIADKYGLKLKNKACKPRTTDSRHNLPTYPNQVKDVIPTRPNQIWVADITYIVLWGLSGGNKNRFAYLSLLMDSYTKEIVGYCLCETLSTDGPLDALRQALRRITDKQAKELIHHSDRGCQYASHTYTSLLQNQGITISMTESGNPKDNAQAERLNSTIKNELLMGKKFHSIEEAREAIEKAIYFYNNKRPHSSLNMMTPCQAAMHEGEITRCWNSFRENYLRGGV